MKKIIKIAGIFLALLVGFTLVACSSDNSTTKEESTRIVTDMGGYDVELPQEVNKVVNLWHANNQVVLLLGGADKLVGTTEIVKGLPWFAYVYPPIKDVEAYALKSGDGNYNTEAIIAADPDVVITSNAEDAEALREVGITAVMVTFRDFDGLKECVKVTAEVLGGDAPKKAQEFIDYFDGNLELLEERLGDLTEEEKVKVYQIRGENPLQTDGKISIATQWIEAAGGINVAAAMSDDNQAEVTIESVLAADPEAIIVAKQNPQPVVDDILSNPTWENVTAVKEGKVYPNPVGTFLWSRYSCEEALQVLWTAKTLYPDKFEDIDMVETVQDFYKDFYDFDMSEADAEQMLKGLNPL